jgi:hypothetical protein
VPGRAYPPEKMSLFMEITFFDAGCGGRNIKAAALD